LEPESPKNEEEPIVEEAEKPKTGFSFKDALLKNNTSKPKTPNVTKVTPNVPVTQHIPKKSCEESDLDSFTNNFYDTKYSNMQSIKSKNQSKRR